MQSHYRKQLTFSYSSLDGAENAYKKLKNRVLSLSKEGEVDTETFNTYKNNFVSYLEDDINTANAISVIYDVLKANTNDLTKYELIKDFDKVLGLELTTETNNTIQVDIEFINSKIEERNEAKKNKNYELADQIRNELLEMGIILKDTREGTTFEIKK